MTKQQFTTLLGSLIAASTETNKLDDVRLWVREVARNDDMWRAIRAINDHGVEAIGGAALSAIAAKKGGRA